MIDIWKYTTFWTQNFARHFYNIKNEQDFEFFLSQKFNDWYFVFWWGSNLLFSQKNYDNKVFIKYSLTWFEQIDTNVFLVNAGSSVSLFINYLNWIGINVFNPLFWLPWSIGGAVVWNAGSYGVQIWDFIKTVFYINEDWNLIQDNDYTCSYRESSLKGKNIILTKVVLDLNKVVQLDIQSTDFYLQKRKNTQEYLKTCWSYFKNPVIEKNNTLIIDKINELNLSFYDNSWDKDCFSIPAWWLIEAVWMKWFEHNWVRISNKHANFFVNYNNLDPSNILELSSIVKQKVYDKFSIELKEEVIIV